MTLTIFMSKNGQMCLKARVFPNTTLTNKTERSKNSLFARVNFLRHKLRMFGHPEIFHEIHHVVNLSSELHVGSSRLQINKKKLNKNSSFMKVRLPVDENT